nr:pancreatic triacylglycerol lipase-like [Lytechinus pictus]
MKIYVPLFALLFAYHVQAAEICYEGLGCFTDDLECHKYRFPPQTLEEINLHFYLYTRRTRDTPYELFWNDVENIRSSNFDPLKKTKIVTHGFLGNYSEPIYADIKDAFIAREDVNFILLDWRDGAVTLYPRAMQNARVVARQLSLLIKALNREFGAYYKDVHIMGYSLGGHVAGYVGQEIPGLGRITGLDPAGPGFQNTDIPECRLDKSDAILVDVIHTDGRPAGYGTLTPFGHMDFYPNGGLDQEGCSLDVVSVCSHMRGRDYFLESLVNQDCHFTSYPCSDWNSFRLGRCTSCGDGGCPSMGIDAELNPIEGSFYLRTNAQSPFCIE